MGAAHADPTPQPEGSPMPADQTHEEVAAAEVAAQGEGGQPDPLAPDQAEPAALEPPDPFEELARERDELKEALIRLQADFENYRKRVAKQEEEMRQRAAASLVEKLLPVLDTAELALAHGGGEDVKQIYTALSSVLEKEGLERIDPIGGAFDPNLHDAVVHEPGEGAGQEVAEVMRPGYMWRGRVLRAAMVKVRG